MDCIVHPSRAHLRCKNVLVNRKAQMNRLARSVTAQLVECISLVHADGMQTGLT